MRSHHDALKEWLNNTGDCVDTLSFIKKLSSFKGDTLKIDSEIQARAEAARGALSQFATILIQSGNEDENVSVYSSIAEKRTQRIEEALGNLEPIGNLAKQQRGNQLPKHALENDREFFMNVFFWGQTLELIRNNIEILSYIRTLIGVRLAVRERLTELGFLESQK
jgi:hypothetical protein